MSQVHPYFEVGSLHRLDNATPSLHAHYRRFNATTDGSAPGSCIGILPRGVCHLSFPFTTESRFSRSVPKPISSSCRLYTDCRLSSKQVALRLIRGTARAPRFDSVWFLSMSHRRFAFAHLLDTYLPPLSDDVSRVAHHHAFWTQQHAVVWGLPLQTDPGGPTPIFFTAPRTYLRVRDTPGRGISRARLLKNCSPS
jgi:hypothetical protein